MRAGKHVLDFWQFIFERQRIWKSRQEGELVTYKDPVLRSQFFTNVFRELDPGTDVAREIMSHRASAETRLLNVITYRRINREDTWRDVCGSALLRAVEDVRGFFEALRVRKDVIKLPVFTDAHQVYPMPMVPGTTLIDKLEYVTLGTAADIEWLTPKIQRSINMKEAFETIRDAGIPGIGGFLAWQIALDLRYGRAINPHSDDDWAPVQAGAKVGLTLYMNWPNVGVVMVGQIKKDALEKRFPAGVTIIKPPSKTHLELALLSLRDIQDEQFDCRGLDFESVAHPDHKRLTLAAIEHALCEWQKYVGASCGLIGGNRRYGG